MKKIFSKVVIGLFFIIAFDANIQAQINTPSNPTVPFGSNSSYAYGIMPTNLPNTGTYGKGTEVAAKYNAWKSAYIENCGTDKARVKFDNTSQTVSEGIGYGMLLAAYAADQDLFNRLWAYYKQHRNGNGVMHWRINGCNNVDGQNGATDAELDAAMALIVANHQWPNKTSPHNYKTDAVALINAIKTHEINASDFTFENGDVWKPQCRNPSYQAPGYARVFKVFMSENGQGNDAFWNNVIQKTENLLINNAHATSGLATNWCTPAGPPNSSCSGSGTAPDKFGYDACRAPWRQATDFIWYGAASIGAITNRQAAFWIGKGGAGQVKGGDGINHDGSGNGDHNAAFVGPIGALSLATSNTTANQNFCNALYTENKNDGLSVGYFTKILQMMGLFVQSGNFWNPYAITSTTSTTSINLTAPTLLLATEGDIITVSATATKTSGTISKVEFYAGSVLIGTDNNDPYSISWTANVSGNVSLTAVATNSNNDVATSSPITMTIYKGILLTTTSPTIDGTIEALWNGPNTAASLKNTISGTISGAADLSATYKAMWDATNFYLLVDVIDDQKKNDSGTQIYNDDAVEVFIDIGNDKATTYGANDFQYTFRWNDNTVYEKTNKITDVTFAKKDNGSGYVMEIKFPWSTLTASPATNQAIGFDVAINDDDDGGDRDGKLSWAATADEAWQNPSYMGTVILKGAACTLPSAAGTITGTNSTCAGTTGVTYSIPVVSGATSYVWNVPAGATITSGANTNSIIVNFGSSNGDISVTPKNSCGSGTNSSKSISVTATGNASVIISVSPGNNVYQGQTLTFTANPTNGGGNPTYQWKNGSTNIPGATNITYTTNTLPVGNQSISVVMTSNAACVAVKTVNSTPLGITIKPSPNFDTQISGPANVGSNQSNVGYSVSNQAGMVYLWTVPPGAVIVSGQNTSSIVVKFGTTSGQVSVKETKPAGQTSTISTSVQVGTTTPIDLPKNGIAISAYPIPCNDIVYISMDGITEMEGTYMLVDMKGNIVQTDAFVYSNTPFQIRTDIAAGVYQLILQWDENISMTRIVKY